MTEHDRDQRRPRIRVTDKRRVSADPDRADAPLGSAVSESAAGDPSVVGEERAPEDEDGAPEEGEGKAAEYLEDLRRLKAEFENYRKRVGKEQTRAIDLAAAPVMAKLLEVLDEFELALMAADRSPDFERFVRGVEMVYAKLTEVLRSEGLEPIEAEGKRFDPARHEALLQADGEGDPYVADVLRPGYTLKGRVLRPAGVKVARR